MMNLGPVLADWRHMQRLTFQGAADRIDIPVSVYTHLETGKDVKGSNLATVLAWLLSERGEVEMPQAQLALADQRGRAAG